MAASSDVNMRARAWSHKYNISTNVDSPKPESPRVRGHETPMELATIYTLNQPLRLCVKGKASHNKKTSQTLLSKREREVLTWAASGKTAWDTSCILSISTDTVNKHIASAMRKLKACTKTQAVAESIRRGEI